MTEIQSLEGMSKEERRASKLRYAGQMSANLIQSAEWVWLVEQLTMKAKLAEQKLASAHTVLDAREEDRLRGRAAELREIPMLVTKAAHDHAAAEAKAEAARAAAPTQ